MKTTFSKTSKLIALTMMLLASFTVFTACGSDDDDESNIVKIDGQETKVVGMTAQEVEENVIIGMVIQPVQKEGRLETLNFTFPIKSYGKTIACKAENVSGSLFNSNMQLNKGSQYMVNKTEDGVYKIKFQLSQTIEKNTTTVAGSYEGKPTGLPTDK